MGSLFEIENVVEGILKTKHIKQQYHLKSLLNEEELSENVGKMQSSEVLLFWKTLWKKWWEDAGPSI